MLLHNDDDVHRFQGRWIEVRGTVMPMQARYSAWGVFAGAWGLCFLVAFGVLGLDTGAAFVDSFAVALFLTVLVMRFVEGDLGLRALCETVALDATSWVRASTTREPVRPVRADYSSVVRRPATRAS